MNKEFNWSGFELRPPEHRADAYQLSYPALCWWLFLYSLTVVIKFMISTKMNANSMRKITKYAAD